MKRRLFAAIRYPAKRFRRFVMVQLLHANDPPRTLALGVAIGVFVTFTPTVGFQMALVLLLAWLLGANKVVGLPIVWISNPATFVPIYYPCYWVGRMILQQPGIDQQWWAEFGNQTSFSFSFYWSKAMEIAAPLWLGCLVVAFALAYPSYYLVYFVIRSYRLQRWGQLTPPPPPSLEADEAGAQRQPSGAGGPAEVDAEPAPTCDDAA